MPDSGPTTEETLVFLRRLAVPVNRDFGLVEHADVIETYGYESAVKIFRQINAIVGRDALYVNGKLHVSLASGKHGGGEF